MTDNTNLAKMKEIPSETRSHHNRQTEDIYKGSQNSNRKTNQQPRRNVKKGDGVWN